MVGSDLKKGCSLLPVLVLVENEGGVECPELREEMVEAVLSGTRPGGEQGVKVSYDPRAHEDLQRQIETGEDEELGQETGVGN